ncbi:delta-1-pyrroline-5-carboxylate synthase-like isoform X2 [Sitophilus oryzae]|uniref:Delta-1-pyrroline-5-carboxylate synthase n=1 Tax=Sitophilus oryzae TaxID=7048 RepID=A0A6J2XVY2_SITOR|nr:delta-1-pyrroline-5-carboxylate synthase-like isoform X2 [Sitophilus oryzae]
MDFHKMIVRNSRISVYKNVRFLTSKSNITQAQAQPAEAIEKACSQDRPKQPMADRSHLHSAKRIMIKFGSAVIIEGQGQGIAMSRLANLVEQMAHIFLQNKEVMFITSGCVAHGRSKLASKTSQFYKTDGKPLDKKPSAAVGQPALMNLYETLFSRYHIQTAQVLVSENDIYNDDNRRVLTETLNQLMDMRVIPILNTNDAVVPQPNVPCPTLCKGIKLADNDSLAAMLAADTQTDLLLMLTVVDGVYDKGPNDPNTKVLHSITETNTQHIDFIGQSQIGLGGMQTKVNSGLWALAHGTSVVICNGKTPDIMQTVLSGKKVGTFFSLAACEDDSTEKIAAAARTGGRALALLPGEKRAECIKKIADLLESKSKEIIAANELDIREAKKIGYSTVLIDRLKLNEPKLKSLSVGLRQISEYSAKILGKIIRKTQLAENLELTQVTVPIGVLLVIFESRPDALPQIASLAIGSGNGLVLKGGDEAVHSNRKLMDIIDEALASVNSSGAVGLVNTKEEIADLINMDQYIDLIIPRGSYKLVRFIQDNAKRIPVMGHSEGICHIFVDKDMCLEKALKILKDAKTDYPSGCNAVETILIHKDLMEGDFFSELCSMLKESGVTLHSGPNLMKYLQFGPPLAKTMKHEYSGMECCLEVVDNVQQAVDHIHKYGSGHTESIITENRLEGPNLC